MSGLVRWGAQLDCGHSLWDTTAERYMLVKGERTVCLQHESYGRPHIEDVLVVDVVDDRPVRVEPLACTSPSASSS